jgi:hypothetical protein
MKTTPLPSTLSVHDRIVQVKYAPSEVLTVFKIDDCDSSRVYLQRENGTALRQSQSIQILRGYDYKLVTGTTN